MDHRRAILLAREIRGLYARSCELATQYNRSLEEETRELREACRARPQKLVPELEYFETIFDRQEAMQKALAHPSLKLRQQTLIGALWSVIFVFAWLGLQSGGSLLGGLVIPIVLGVAAVILQQRLLLGSEAFRRNLREQLVARGVPLCLHCGYDLRGQVGQAALRCPECGKFAAHLRNNVGVSRALGGTAHAG